VASYTQMSGMIGSVLSRSQADELVVSQAEHSLSSRVPVHLRSKHATPFFGPRGSQDLTGHWAQAFLATSSSEQKNLDGLMPRNCIVGPCSCHGKRSKQYVCRAVQRGPAGVARRTFEQHVAGTLSQRYLVLPSCRPWEVAGTAECRWHGRRALSYLSGEPWDLELLGGWGR
jgi:hypothetical protein